MAESLGALGEGQAGRESDRVLEAFREGGLQQAQEALKVGGGSVLQLQPQGGLWGKIGGGLLLLLLLCYHPPSSEPMHINRGVLEGKLPAYESLSG